MAPDEEEIDESLFPDEDSYKEAEGFWQGGEEAASKGRPVGSFQAKILSATLERSASSDRLQIHYHLEITGGTNDKEIMGIELHKYDGLGSEEQAGITQQQLSRIGVPTKGVSVKTLPAVLLSLTDKQIVIKTQKKDQYYNIYFTKAMGTSVAGPRPGGGAAGVGAHTRSTTSTSRPAPTRTTTGGSFKR